MDSVDNNPASIDCDAETLQSVTEFYRQHGKVSGEKSTQSPTTTPESSLRRPTPTRKQPINLPTEEETRTLLAQKLIVLTNFQ
jgi:hypothetical protein